MLRFGKTPVQKVVVENLDISYSQVWMTTKALSDMFSNEGVVYLTESSNGTGFLHKSKKNSNGTFSVGKTWQLSEVRTVQVVNVSCGM
jgi:exocyst complex component 1